MSNHRIHPHYGRPPSYNEHAKECKNCLIKSNRICFLEGQIEGLLEASKIISDQLKTEIERLKMKI